MDSKIRIKILRNKDIKRIEQFLLRMGNSGETFRYFANRPLSVIENHVVTILAVNEKDYPVGYGHLDLENDQVWLGICVAQMERGHGIGKMLMQFLLAEADRHLITTVYLSVDQNNTPAIKLYRKFGFSESDKKGDVCIFYRRLSKS